MIQAVHCFVANYFWVSYLAYLGHGRSQLPLESRKETVKEKLMRKDFKLMRREKKKMQREMEILSTMVSKKLHLP